MVWSIDPWREVDRMRRNMNRFLSAMPFANSYQFPLVNIYDRKDEFTVIAEIPGLKKEDISITIRDNMMTISGKRTVEEHNKNYSVLRCELPEGEFQKTLRMPAKVKESDVKASYEDGILRITLPKSEEVRPRQITIES